MRACATADTVRYGTERATGNELLKRPINARQGTLSLTKIIETNEVRVTEMHKMLEPEQQLGDYRSTRVSVLSTAHGEKNAVVRWAPMGREASKGKVTTAESFL